MNTNLKAALDAILSDEGSELNIGGSEPGGASRYGVSLTALSEWRIAHGQSKASVDDVAAVTPDVARDIYAAKYAVPTRFDDLPAGVDYRMLDMAVNLGVHGAADSLQLALGVWPLSGSVDDATVAAVKTVSPAVIIRLLSAVWISKKHESPNWGPSPITKTGYGHGWSNRNNRATALALGMVTP